MLKPELDILIPTGRERLHNCLFQIRAILSSGVNARVNVLMGEPWAGLDACLSPTEKAVVRINEYAPDSPKYKGQQKVLWALENMEDIAPWFAYFSDDDALLPWGLKALMDNREGVDMVMGRVLGVSRTNHTDFTPYTINRAVIRNRCSNAGAIYRTDSVKTLPRPWIDLDDPCSDWGLMDRLSRSFPHKAIPDTISVLTLYEMEQFDQDVRRTIERHNGIQMAVAS